MMALRWALWRRQVRQAWRGWRESGGLVVAAYAAAIGLVLLVGAWQSLRDPLTTPDSALAVALACAYWLSAGLIRRPVFGIGPADELLLRTPAPPREVLLWPLLARLGPGTGVALAAGLALALCWPHWSAVALALPLLVAGRGLLQAVFDDSRLRGQGGWLALLAAFLPLLGALHPLGLSLGALLGVAGLAWRWHHLWADAVPPLALRRWQVEGQRQGAGRLGLPVPEVGPDGLPTPRWLRLSMSGQGAFAAALWQSGLHLLRRRRWLLLTLAVMPLLGVGLGFLAAPSLGLDPLLLRGLPLLFAQLWAGLLVLLGPASPAALPLAGPLNILARVLPAASWLGLLSGVGAALSAAGVGTVFAALLVPGTALAALAWLGNAAPGGLSSPASLRFSAATLPTLLVSLCGGVWGGWLAPVLLLVLSFAAVWMTKS